MATEFENLSKSNEKKGIFRLLEEVSNLEEGEDMSSLKLTKKATGLDLLVAKRERKVHSIPMKERTF